MTIRSFLTLVVLGCLLDATAAPALAKVQGAGSGGTPSVSTSAGIPAHWLGPGPLHKVRIQGDAGSQLASIEAAGALVRSTDYGGFTLAIVDERAFGGADAFASQGFDVRDEMDLMVFNGTVLDGLRPRRALAGLDAAERFTDPATLAFDARAGLYVVQFEGPVRDEWLTDLAALGGRFSQFVPMNAFVIHVPDDAVEALQALGRAAPHIQYVGAYEPAFRIHPVLRAELRAGAPEPLPVTIQLVDMPGVQESLARIVALAEVVEQVWTVGPYVNVQALVHPVFLQTLAADRSVFQLEPRGEITALDERQGQIMAGNVGATGPSAPGYLAWLAAAGFNGSQFGSFAVNVVDGATSLIGHPDLPAGRVVFVQNPSGQSGPQDGHGFLNAHIVAGFNAGSGPSFEDTGGYNYGLGIAPWARVMATAIFGPVIPNATSYEGAAYSHGARISTNSWGYVTMSNAPIPDYDAFAQEYDFITRDAQGGMGGNQEYLVVFAAGNDGPGANTVSTPGTAKNIITVGAGENDRQTGTDGCGCTNADADNYNDIADFSSHGPVDLAGGDGRWKPEISAPGTHIQAGVPQTNYCGPPCNDLCDPYWPAGQMLYSWSSGTSHSTPAVAGHAALIRQHFLNRGMSAPSPAMVKASIVNAARYMNGALANDTLPSNSQGMGSADIGRAVDGAARILVDQTRLLTASGDSHVVGGTVADGGEPFRVTLVWTDAPGPTSGAPYVNDLDLSVSVGGNTYLGNVFSGPTSTTGGSSDTRNNTESVFLPAGQTGSFTVTVGAASIGGDGVPGVGDSTDQDFALLVYNATESIGTSYCSPNNLNSTGVPGTLTATGSTSAAAMDVLLEAGSLPLNQFGYFIASRTQGFIPMPGNSDGNLCLGGQVGRYNQAGRVFSTGATGTGNLQVGDISVPTNPFPPGEVITAGDSWNWQAWYRDVGNTNNFTEGLNIGFN